MNPIRPAIIIVFLIIFGPVTLEAQLRSGEELRVGPFMGEGTPLPERQVQSASVSQ